MKFGIIGYGKMGKIYEKVLEDMEIKTEFICDKITSETNKRFYTDYKEALKNEEVDGLVIATHAPSHYEIVDYAISKQIKYIACEKPFTTSVSTANKLISKSKISQTRLTINYSRRFSRAYSKLYHILYNEKIIGEPRSISIFCGAGGISTIGTHFFDLCNFLLNEKPTSIYAVPVDRNRPNPRGPQFRDPGGYVLINFENQKRAFIDIGDDLGLQPTIEIVCEYGRIFVDEINKKIKIIGRTKENQTLPKHLYGTENILIKKEKFSFESLDFFIRSMLENLISNQPLIVTPQIAGNKVEIYSAIRKSFETKSPVTLPLNDLYCEKEFAVT